MRPWSALSKPGKAVGARHAGQLAVGLVGPGMIGADDPLGRHRLVAIDQARAAMAADVGEDMRLALPVAA